MKGDVLLGALTLTKTDQPFYYCSFQPAPAFAELAPLFAAELRSLLDFELIEALRITLFPLDGSTPIAEFLLHVSGKEDLFRY
jgi:hypothetical protein